MFTWTVLTTPQFISYFWLISILYSGVCFCRCCIVNSLILWDTIDMVWHKMKHFSSSESQAFLIFHFAEQFKIPTSASLIWSRSKFWTTGISLRWKFISSNPCGRMSACGVKSILHLFVCVSHDKCHKRVPVHVQVLIPPVCCHQGLFLAYYCTVMSQRRKSAITFPYIILMSSHSSTDPSQPILTHEIWQATPEVM